MNTVHHAASAPEPTFVLRHDWAQDTLLRARLMLHPDDPFLKALLRQTAKSVAPDERQRDQGSSLLRRPAPAASPPKKTPGRPKFS